MMKKMMLLVAAAAMTLAPMTASAARVVVFGGPGFYGPGFYGSYWGPYGRPVYGYTSLGEVKIDTKSKNGEVFVNGAFAGSTKDARTMHLVQGTYNIEVRQSGAPVLNEQVFVTAGKTIHLHPAL